jgi:hypothetical protein
MHIVLSSFDRINALHVKASTRHFGKKKRQNNERVSFLSNSY